MALPEPEPGLVIAYDYLWLREHRRARDEGRKTRPCVIVVSIVSSENGRRRVSVVPVTHTPPETPANAIEMPLRLKQALGLDDGRSWIMLDEVNQFDCPGFDLRPVPGNKGRFQYGHIPPKLFDQVRQRIGALVKERRIGLVRRD